MDAIKKRINRTSFSISANAQLLDSNCLKSLSKISPLSQVVNVNEGNLSNSESIGGLKVDFNIDKEVDLFDLAMDADQDQS